MSAQLEFIYVLRLNPPYLARSNWTEATDQIVQEHFQYLVGLKEEGKLVLAGRTQTFDEKTFGISIIKEESLEAANVIMQNDPGIVKGLMNAELFPFKTAIS